MIINFKEIPKANKGGGNQDVFEQFACDFLETIGYEILQRPDRGADGKKDLIICETRRGVEGKTEVKWLVSCKHYAHSGRSVSDVNEEDPKGRVDQHCCNGFMGFYSTIPSSALSNKLSALKDRIEVTTFDKTRIEKEILKSTDRDRLLASYFPESHEKYRKNKIHESLSYQDGSTKTTPLSEADVFRITKTSIIILELEKIKEEYYSKDWNDRDDALRKIFRYSDHSNEIVAGAIFDFLSSVSYETRGGMPGEIASIIESLIISFFPSSSNSEDKEEMIENGTECIHVGFVMIYDAFIHLNDFDIALNGLLILKYIYSKAKHLNLPVLSKAVLDTYENLESTLERPERTDFGNAKEFLSIFRTDLETSGLVLPSLPDHLYNLAFK